jgi:hypothetical protein
MSDDDRSDVGLPRGRRGWRWDAPVLVALVAVPVAVADNAIQARDNARLVENSQHALQLTVAGTRLANLLDLQAKIADADRRTNEAFAAASGRGQGPKQIGQLVQAVTPLEGIAYAIRHGLIAIPRASALWRRYLVCASYTARAKVGGTLDSYVPELARFAKAERSKLGADHRCVWVVA